MESAASIRKARRREWWKKKKEELRKKRDKRAAGKSTIASSVERKPTLKQNVVEEDSKRGFRSSAPVSYTPQWSQRVKVHSEESDQSTSSDDQSDNERKEMVSYTSTQKSTNKGKKTKQVKLSPTEQKESKEDEDANRKRYILFLGNLPHEASRDDIIEHFSKRGVPISELRLLTDRESGKSKGCAFAEFSSGRAMQNAIKFHRSKLQGRTINVEVTCGGGGKGDKRQEKIRERNRKMRRTNTVKSGKAVKHTKTA